MNEFDIIKNYFQKLTNNNPAALNLNDDVFFYEKTTGAFKNETRIRVSNKKKKKTHL